MDGKKWDYLAVANLSELLAKNHQIMMEIFIVQTAFIHTPQRINLKNMKKYVIITIAVI